MSLNDTINWKPQSTGTGRFGKWLENLQDWNLSRSRFGELRFQYGAQKMERKKSVLVRLKNWCLKFDQSQPDL